MLRWYNSNILYFIPAHFIWICNQFIIDNHQQRTKTVLISYIIFFSFLHMPWKNVTNLHFHKPWIYNTNAVVSIYNIIQYHDSVYNTAVEHWLQHLNHITANKPHWMQTHHQIKSLHAISNAKPFCYFLCGGQSIFNYRSIILEVNKH